ncbi:hypothetical protein [Streptomyces sp. B1-3]|uniref:hypothetical protein n=1 Tax=Streptomyces sp. B1-3 TaxID=3141453 RepID=UPI003D291761
MAVLLTVPGTVWAVLVAQDQLNQSDEAAVKEERAQASRVSAWTSQDPHGKWLIHVMNRSPDPIAEVYVSFVYDDAMVSRVKWAVALQSLPPCSDMTISQGQLKFDVKLPSGNTGWSRPEDTLPKLKGHRWLSLDRPNTRLQLDRAAFTDRNGVGWLRHQGRLFRLPARPLGALTGVAGPVDAPSGFAGLVLGQPTYRAIGECGEGNGG